MISSIPQDLKDKNRKYLRSLLSCYIASYAEYRNRDNHKFFNDWSESYTGAMFGARDEETDRIRFIIRKYDKLEAINEFEALNPELTQKIVSHIRSGEDLTDCFIKILKDKSKEPTALDKLCYYWDKSNEEFDKCYGCLIKDLLNGTIIEPVNIGKAVAYMAYFASNGLKKIGNDLLSKLSNYLTDIPSSYKTLEDLNRCRYQFTQGYNFVRGFDKEKAITNSVVDSFYEEVNRLEATIPDDIQVILRTLSDENVGKLIDIDNTLYPNQISEYRMRPILMKENPEKLCAALCSMSNKGRNRFGDFLTWHYDNEAIATIDYFNQDLNVLTELKRLLAEEALNKVSVEKFSYDNLLKVLEKVIKKCSREE